MSRQQLDGTALVRAVPVVEPLRGDAGRAAISGASGLSFARVMGDCQLAYWRRRGAWLS